MLYAGRIEKNCPRSLIRLFLLLSIHSHFQQGRSRGRLFKRKFLTRERLWTYEHGNCRNKLGLVFTKLKLVMQTASGSFRSRLAKSENSIRSRNQSDSFEGFGSSCPLARWKKKPSNDGEPPMHIGILITRLKPIPQKRRYIFSTN